MDIHLEPARITGRVLPSETIHQGQQGSVSYVALMKAVRIRRKKVDIFQTWSTSLITELSTLLGTFKSCHLFAVTIDLQLCCVACGAMSL